MLIGLLVPVVLTSMASALFARVVIAALVYDWMVSGLLAPAVRARLCAGCEVVRFSSTLGTVASSRHCRFEESPAISHPEAVYVNDP